MKINNVEINNARDVFIFFKEKAISIGNPLPQDLWNMDWQTYTSGRRGKTNGHERVHRVYKKMQLLWEKHGTFDLQKCENPSCDVTAFPAYYAFFRDAQHEGGWLIVFQGDIIKATGNPRQKNYNGEEIMWLEFDHINPKTKKNEMSQMIQRNELKKILKEDDLCQLLCFLCHRDKTKAEATFSYKGKPELPYDEAVRLIKEYVKPLNRIHFAPGTIHKNRYGKGALDEAIEKARANGDMALYDDLKRIPRNPYATYKERGIDVSKFWRAVTGNISSSEGR